jgi:hypothetical protein
MTLDQIKIAKNALKLTLGRPDWLRGIGIGADAQGYFIKVNVSKAIPDVTNQITAALSKNPDKVRIEIEEVGDIVAF